MNAPDAPETQVVFPWSLAEAVFDLLQERKVRIIRYCDLDFAGSRVGSAQRYWDEYVRFRAGRVNPLTVSSAMVRFAFLRWGGRFPLYQQTINFLFGKSAVPTVILQHDADSLPNRTLEMMRREQRRRLVSSCYFFVEHAEGEAYDLDIEALQSLEASGFEIGYHQNAYERSGYDRDRAFRLVASDLDWLQKRFRIRSFVPHGGRPSKEGLNNDHLPHAGRLKPLLWAYNGRCILKEYTWSDGGIHKRTPENPKDFVRKLANGSRAMMLMHPQYYGDRLRDDWSSLPIVKERWWRELWGL